jgi:hypothetical protein
MKPYEDPNNIGNSQKYHTGKLCIEGCGRPAGTAWSPFWCQECNAKRINRISEELLSIVNAAKEKSTGEGKG